MTDRGLFLGRFQPFHLGHLDVVTRLAASHEELIVAVGSANVSHTAANPFTGGERVEMVRAALRDARVDNALVLPIPDIGRNTLWAAHVASLVPRFQTVHTNNPLPSRLFAEAGYKVAPIPFFERERFEGTSIRRRIAEDHAWRDLVPPAVARLITAVDGPARLREHYRPDGAVEGFDPSV